MDQHATEISKVVVLGDFNIHFENTKDLDSTRFQELLDILNLEQHVREPTHNRGHTLDLVVTRLSDPKPMSLDVHPAVFSDHCPITFRLNMKCSSSV